MIPENALEEMTKNLDMNAVLAEINHEDREGVKMMWVLNSGHCSELWDSAHHLNVGVFSLPGSWRCHCLDTQTFWRVFPGWKETLGADSVNCPPDWWIKWTHCSWDSPQLQWIILGRCSEQSQTSQVGIQHLKEKNSLVFS